MTLAGQHGTREVIDIRPHPRLLSVLGDIEFAPWQCLAELVDNSFDDFLTRPPDSREAPTVSITLPGRVSTPHEGQVWVRDNGNGMDLERLNLALRAGWTGNRRHGQLGLFGMGFNIATARLGHITRVRTTRAGDPEWISVVIDLRTLQGQSEFVVPVVREPKTDPGEHGTEVIVSDLKSGQHDVLSRQGAKIRDQLGDVYSYLLRERDFRLLVGNSLVRPRRPCVWARNRSVVRSGVRIPAVIDIDERLPDQAACQACGRWQDPLNSECDECGSSDVEVRERRIHGWLGVQRYLDKSDYGIDFLRNGRKILIRDVRLFRWSDPNEPGDRGQQEYPIEVPNEGRLVGEVHCDHVGVNYQKNAFEYDTPEWRKVVRTLRGDAPLRPEIAKRLSYPVNNSPLALLFTGYRRNNPGLSYLTPGDGKKAIHERTREWAALFRKGVEEYQTDEVWYRAASQHDEIRRRPVPPEATDTDPAGGDREGGNVLTRLGLDPPPGATTNPVVPHPEPPRPESDDDRRERWRRHGSLLPDLEGRYQLRGLGAALEVKVWAVRGAPLVDAAGVQAPVFVAAGRGPAVEVFIDAEHPLFTDFAADLRDVAVTELAEYLRVRADVHRPLSAVVYDLRDQCLPDTKVTPNALADQANLLLEQIREAMLPVIAGASEGFWQSATHDERLTAERRFAAEDGSGDWADARATGEWIRYVPPTALARLLQQRPADFLDGRVFRARYSTFDDAHARDLSLSPVLGYLSDVGILAEHRGRRGAEELVRGRLSCLLLEQELASQDDVEDGNG